MKKSIPFFFCFYLLFSTSLCADNVLKFISNVDGLSNNSVNCIFEDSENIVWIGTWDGLNAYDGKEIRTFRYNRNNKFSISNNIIRQIIEQDKVHLWITTDHGINVWNKHTEEFTSFFHGDDNKPKQENSYMIGVLSNKIICSYIKGRGWFYYDERSNIFQPLSISLKQGIKSFVIDNEDNLYVLLENGNVYTTKVKINSGVPQLGKLIRIEVLSNVQVEKLFFSDNKLLFYSKEKIIVLNKFQNLTEELKISMDKTVSSLIYSKNSIYASFYEGGCVRYNLATGKEENIEGVPQNVSVFSLFFGSQDILWIGTDGQGVIMTYNYTPPFRKVGSEYPVRCFVETDKGEILVGSKGGGIQLLNKTNNMLSNFLDVHNGLQSNSVYALKKNKLGDIFIGTEGKGIAVRYASKNNVEYLQLPSNSPDFKSIYSIHFSDQESTLWLGTSGYGLIKAKLQRMGDGKYGIENIKQFTSSNEKTFIDNDIVYAIADGSTKDELWFGTRGSGLYKININSNEIEKIDVNVLSNNDILSILKTQSSLWIGTGYGLNHLTIENGNVENKEYTDSEGLANNTIHGILEDENSNIWISSNLGLSFFNVDDNHIENYYASDGLQSNEFSDGAYFIDSNKELYFGGVMGFNYFRPSNIVKRNFKPTLRLSSLNIYDTKQSIPQRIHDNTLTLSYDEQYISFSFVTNDFINTENCEFYYRLSDSSNDKWIYNGNNPNVIFTKLDPGNYTLEIKYTNGDKVINDEIYSLNIYVERPWWFSNIAIVIYLVFIVIIIYTVQSIVKNRIRLNRQVLLEKIEKQHQQKMHESKLDFFTNVAHEFFTPLTLIYGPAEHLLETSNLDSYSKRYIQIIKNNAERMQKLISELMDFRKAKSGYKTIYREDVNVKNLVEYTSDSFLEIAEQNEINYKVSIKGDFSISSDRDFLEKILLNLLSNAFKYTPASGYVKLSIWNDESDHLRISVRNSGKGLTKKQIDDIFNKFKIYDAPQLKNSVSTGVGLSLVKSLIDLLSGEIVVESELGEYVEFQVTIPPLRSDQINNQVGIISDPINLEGDSIFSTNIVSAKEVSILVVDDDRNIRELLKDILSPYYHIQEAADGRDALAAVEHSHPSIIISDIMMPHVDGISMIDKLKSDSKTLHIPIISISAKSSVDDSIEAYKHGADMYITKPFHPRHVLATVENLIRKQRELKDYYQLGLSSITLKDGIELHKDDEKFIHNIASFIHENISDETLDPAAIANFTGLSKPTLYRTFKSILDTTPSEFIRTIRLEQAAKLLLSTKYTVMEIMYKSGFNNRSYFYREFSKKYKMSPVEYRNKLMSGK